MNNNKSEILTKLDTIINTKQEELIHLHNKKQDLQENMSNPTSILSNAADIQEKGREIAILHEARDYALDVETDNIKDVFDKLEEDYVDIIEEREDRNLDTTEDRINLEVVKDIKNSNDLNSQDSTESVIDNVDVPDIGSFDE